MKLKNMRVVLMADPVAHHFDASHSDLDLECPSMEYFEAVKNALEKLVKEVIWYKSPQELMENIKCHKEDIVLSIWSGKGNAYRKSFIPAICEAYGIKYVGPDPYVEFLCQDKHLSKLYCKEFDIYGAKEVRIKSMEDCEKIKTLTFPMVIKPNAEGGSNGISQENVVYNYEEATHLCQKLLPLFGSDLLAEEYLNGTEITVILAGTDPHHLLIKQNKIVLDNNIANEIWGLESKKQEIIETPIEATTMIDAGTLEKFRKLFASFKKVELLRIDGRVWEDEFRLLELTPDVSLEFISSSTSAFSQAGFSYDKMFEVLLNNTLDYYKQKA